MIFGKSIKQKSPRVGLALGGGGARGLCHIKICQVLDELEIKPAIISGTSIGAIIGGFYASGMTGIEMEELLTDISFLELHKMIDFSLFDKSSILKGKGAEEFIRKHLRVDTFAELPIPLKIITTDFWKLEEIVISSGKLLPAIRASMSIPGVFTPVNWNDRTLIDGGATNPLPYDQIRDDCDLLIAIDVTGEIQPSQPGKLPSIFDSIMYTFEIMQTSIIKYKLEICKPDLYLKPNIVNVGLLEFHKDEEIFASIESDLIQFRKKLESLLKK